MIRRRSALSARQQLQGMISQLHCLKPEKLPSSNMSGDSFAQFMSDEEVEVEEEDREEADNHVKT